jgi:RNA recognition motif-containing protein
MGKKLYVGNLPYSATDQVLFDTFSQCGNVESAKIIIDRETGRSKGFGFVEMSTDEEATDAIEKFNGADYDGRAITVNEARPQAPRENRSGGGGGGGGGGGYGQGNRDRGGSRGGGFGGGGRSRY